MRIVKDGGKSGNFLAYFCSLVSECEEVSTKRGKSS